MMLLADALALVLRVDHDVLDDRKARPPSPTIRPQPTNLAVPWLTQTLARLFFRLKETTSTGIRPQPDGFSEAVVLQGRGYPPLFSIHFIHIHHPTFLLSLRPSIGESKGKLESTSVFMDSFSVFFLD
jgi:hypothetical protein